MSESSDPSSSPPARSADRYAATYMPGAGRVLLRDKTVGRKLLWLLGAVTLWIGGGAVATFLGALPKSSTTVGVLLSLFAMMFALLTVMFTVVRTVVSEHEVHVQYGLWGPRVPVAKIVSARVVPYDWKDFGGWGIKRSLDGTWAYVMNAGGDVVELRWTDDTGTEKRVLFSASDPAAIVASIEHARAALRGVRVAEGAHQENAVRVRAAAETDDADRAVTAEESDSVRGVRRET